VPCPHLIQCMHQQKGHVAPGNQTVHIFTCMLGVMMQPAVDTFGQYLQSAAGSAAPGFAEKKSSPAAGCAAASAHPSNDLHSDKVNN